MRLCFCPSERENKAQPQLAYVSQVSESNGPFVRFMHMHPQTVELILITEGDGEYFIGDRIYPVRKGDTVIYNNRWCMMSIWKAGGQLALFVVGLTIFRVRVYVRMR